VTVINFHSDFQLLDEMESFDQTTVKNEPMLFSADLAYSASAGGPITREFLKKCPKEFLESPDAIFDSRVHMLMPNWIPAIPGWHLDDVPRTRSDGQPDHVNPAYKAEHVLGIIGDEPQANTEFLVGDIRLSDVELNPKRSIYGIWNDDLEKMISGCRLEPKIVPTKRLVRFNWQSFHRGVPAKGNGWRWFGRLTINTHRKPTNEIRQQVQVYMAWPTEGW
jgi:hypothetical protein